MKIIKLAQIFEKVIIYSLIIMMAAILVLATIELGYFLFKSVFTSQDLLINLDILMELFGLFLLVLIGIELLDTIKVYLKESVVHVEVVVLVAIIAIARKVVVLKIEELSGIVIIGISTLIIALSLSYYLIKKAGLLKWKVGEITENNKDETVVKLKKIEDGEGNGDEK
jgi:uncharacterized membrane protein (DUF373 family)